MSYQKNTFLSYYKGQKLPYPVRCTIRRLEWRDIAQVMKLQSTILDELGQDQTFVSVNEAVDFRPYLTGEKGLMLGVFNDSGKLIAMQSLKVTHTPDIDIQSFTSEPVACLASFMVSHDYRGNRITPQLMGHLMHLSEVKFGVKNFIGYVDAHNPASYTHFLQNGFGVAEAYVDDVFHAPSYAFMFSNDKKVNDKLYFPAKMIGTGDFGFMQRRMKRVKICAALRQLKGKTQAHVKE